MGVLGQREMVDESEQQLILILHQLAAFEFQHGGFRAELSARIGNLVRRYRLLAA